MPRYVLLSCVLRICLYLWGVFPYMTFLVDCFGFLTAAFEFVLAAYEHFTAVFFSFFYFFHILPAAGTDRVA